MIEERVSRERPCRTLFVRNIKVPHFPTLHTYPEPVACCRCRGKDMLTDLVFPSSIARHPPCDAFVTSCKSLPFVPASQYETRGGDVREKFERMGDIKTFFDLIGNRGMVFITYVSLPVGSPLQGGREQVLTSHFLFTPTFRPSLGPSR